MQEHKRSILFVLLALVLTHASWPGETSMGLLPLRLCMRFCMCCLRFAELQFGFKKASMSSIPIFKSAVVLCGAYVHPIICARGLAFCTNLLNLLVFLSKFPWQQWKICQRKAKEAKRDGRSQRVFYSVHLNLTYWYCNQDHTVCWSACWSVNLVWLIRNRESYSPQFSVEIFLKLKEVVNKWRSYR